MLRPSYESNRATTPEQSSYPVQSMFDASVGDRLLEWDVCDRAVEKLLKATSGEGMTTVTIRSFWNGGVRWARNRASMTSDQRNIEIRIFREIGGGRANAFTNQIDDASLEGVVRAVERLALRQRMQGAEDVMVEVPTPPMPKGTTWGDATFDYPLSEAAEFVKSATSASEAKGLMTAGYFERAATRFAICHSANLYGTPIRYNAEFSQAQCSTTVRHPKGTGSGWAGLARYDVNKVDAAALAERALEKCIASVDAVRVEPGRYTTILEPQAVSELARLLVGNEVSTVWRSHAEAPGNQSPYSLGLDNSIGRVRSKLGLKVIDERITISHDPSDPELGTVPGPYVLPVTWIENGVLTALSSGRANTLLQRNDNLPDTQRGSFRMSGGTSTMEEMISTTKRGLIVTKFSSIDLIDKVSVLATGFTRDGLWLVENGKITKAVRNFRFTESPLFAFNNVEQLGVPVPVFQPDPFPEMTSFAPYNALQQIIVPPMKVNDFSFTSTIDAV